MAGWGWLSGCNDDGTPLPPSWQTAFEPGDSGALLCAWGTGPDHVWAVGGQPDAGVIWYHDGEMWSRATVPDGPLLNWTHGTGGRQFIVGNDGRVLTRQDAEMTWSTMDSPTNAPLWGVWAASADEAWAVGGDPISTGEPDPVILHFKGGAWSKVSLPPVDRQFRALFKVWGTAADNVYAVGAKGVILHFDGVQWRQQFAGTPRDIVSLWGTGENEILAVGGRANGVLLRFDGQGWTHKVLETEPGMNGVWMDSSGRAFVVGGRGRILEVRPGSYEYRRADSENRTLLHGVWGTNDGFRVTVGGTLDRNPPWVGVSLDSQYPQ